MYLAHLSAYFLNRNVLTSDEFGFWSNPPPPPLLYRHLLIKTKGHQFHVMVFLHHLCYVGCTCFPSATGTALFLAALHFWVYPFFFQDAPIEIQFLLKAVHPNCFNTVVHFTVIISGGTISFHSHLPITVDHLTPWNTIYTGTAAEVHRLLFFVLQAVSDSPLPDAFISLQCGHAQLQWHHTSTRCFCTVAVLPPPPPPVQRIPGPANTWCSDCIFLAPE